MTELVVICFGMGSTTQSRWYLKFCYLESDEVCACSAKQEYQRYAFTVLHTQWKNENSTRFWIIRNHATGRNFSTSGISFRTRRKDLQRSKWEVSVWVFSANLWWTSSPQPIKNQVCIRNRACLSVWWGHHPRKYEAVMKINKECCVHISSHCVTVCIYKSKVYCNIKYFKYIFCILCFVITHAWLTEECKVFYPIWYLICLLDICIWN